MSSSLEELLGSSDQILDNVISQGEGPKGKLPIDEKLLRESASGDLFGMTQSAGMGWDPNDLLRDQILLLSTQGGIRKEDGTPVALGYHTGHWEVGLLMQEAANELKGLKNIPFAGFVSDPCDGRSQGTTAMMDSLAYRNDAAMVFRRLIRSLPMRKGVMGFATCDKGLPAMMLALAGESGHPSIIVPGGVTLPAKDAEDTGKVQTIGARFAYGDITLDYAAEMGCKSCGSSGGGCQFLGTAATSQVVAEAWGMSLPHSALAPSGQPIWLEMAKQSAIALNELKEKDIPFKKIVTKDSLHNAMVVHAAVGGSTNLLLHIPAVAFEAGFERPTVEDWSRINRMIPRLVDVMPNGPMGHPTIRLFLAGGVPEIMLHLRNMGVIKTEALTVAGKTWGEILDWWENSDRRRILREKLKELDGVNPDDVIMSPEQASQRGLTSTVTFPVGNIAPEGSVIKSTAIDPEVVDDDGVYRKTGPVRFFTSERDAVAAVKGQTDNPIKAGDIIILCCRGPLGAGMEETYQITAALRYLDYGKHVAVITDARFSGVSTGACIGHVGPEALSGGPIGKLRDGDVIEIIIDRNELSGSINFIGDAKKSCTPEEGEGILEKREPVNELKPDPDLPSDTRLWALLQQAGGGTWGGCVYDVDAIEAILKKK
jgi:xylonate dehydratase